MTARTSTMRFLRALGRALGVIKDAWTASDPERPMVPDGRGRSVSVYRLDRYTLGEDRSETLPRPVFERMKAGLLTQSQAGMRWTPLVTFLMGVYCAWNFLRSTSAATWLGFDWLQLGLALLFMWGAVVFRFRIPKVSRQTIAAAMLAERRCPSCAYDLSATDPDPDGLTTGPECGAAWKLSPKEVGA